MNYREPLPDGCPPDTAEEIIQPRDVFRLVRTDPPTEEDFKSQRAEKPGHTFSGVDECQVRGLSVHTERRDSENALKLPKLRGRLICRLRLGFGAGKILQTGRRSHHTWWPLADYDVLVQCTVETT